MDYRDIPAEFEHQFDAFISIEMLEHVGAHVSLLLSVRSHFHSLSSKPSTTRSISSSLILLSNRTMPPPSYHHQRSLNQDILGTSTPLLHLICIQGPHLELSRAEDFMRKYMWPNSCLPSATVLITAAQSASHGRFTLDGVENHAARMWHFSTLLVRTYSLMIPKDYPRTLRTWGRRMEENLTQKAMSRTHPALGSNSEFRTFKRKWEYLFAYAGAGFTKGYITCHMLTFIRPVGTKLFLPFANLPTTSRIANLRMTSRKASTEYRSVPHSLHHLPR